MPEPLDFQTIIMSLQHFWADHGCLIWQPYYTQVGAGTYNPATFLRVLGPEPWNVAYVEPSIRPDDGRYGENPNRMQQHYQFQVILKPDPGNPQELYLNSLEAVGIDPRMHDIRFVEDNWESPALGAWGLGWEVWLDGQEITQFTYFQQAGGIVLDPVSVELTYGLDRIAITLQRVRGFQDIRWNTRPKEGLKAARSLTAGDVNLQAEQQHSQYYFEVADVGRLRQMYDLFEAEAKAALEKGLVLPAHDYILKCSHTFNVLDTRGAIGVTERQALFGRMRDLARLTANTYLEQRQRQEYPWLDESTNLTNGDSRLSGVLPAQETTTPAPLLFEIGTEELPAGDLESALNQLSQRVPVLLADLRLKHGEVTVSGTPRRLVITVADLDSQQSGMEQVVKGPPASRAFDSLGVPTPAAEGFARSKGVSVGDLQIRELDGGKYVTAMVRSPGQPTLHVLAGVLPGLVAALRFDKSMRWNTSNVSFSRPIRWLLALYGEQIVPFEYAGLHSGRITRGLRFSHHEEIQVRDLTEYLAAMQAQGIILGSAERLAGIQQQLIALSSQVGGSIAADSDLVAEVTNLVEAPAGICGSFDVNHLELPREVLTSVMKKHQRYFPVEKAGKLMPYFIAITNRGGNDFDQDQELVIEGNEHVIRARFADAAFFINDDLKKPLEDYLPRLDTLIFQTKLGSMLDKTRRIQQLTDDLIAQTSHDPDQVAIARRAAWLCKADLVTKMVVEMTSLQGVIGQIYALRSGESPEVAQAIFEHYLPRYAGDRLPVGLPGLVVGLADRLDTLSGLFAAGLAPTGAKDPFGQRRAALGLVSNLIGWDMDFDLRRALSAAARRLPLEMSDATRAACLTFIIERLRNMLLEKDFRYDIVDSVLAVQGDNPARALRAVQSLEDWVKRPDWSSILPAYARCVRITRDQAVKFDVDPSTFVEPAERNLFAALQTAEMTQQESGSVNDFLVCFLPMIPTINQFFEDVLVMTENQAQRENRLGLLQRVASLADGVADFSRLEGF